MQHFNLLDTVDYRGTPRVVIGIKIASVENGATRYDYLTEADGEPYGNGDGVWRGAEKFGDFGASEAPTE